MSSRNTRPVYFILRVLLYVFAIILGSALFHYKTEWYYHTACSSPPLPESQEKLLERDIISDITQENVSFTYMSQKKMCSCNSVEKEVELYHLKDYWDTSDLQSAVDRRKKEYEHVKRREQRRNVLIAPPNSPLSYPMYGVQVMPLGTILLPGLKINVTLQKYKVTLQASLGTIDFKVNMTSVAGWQAYGRGKKSLTISTNNLNVLNRILSSISYTSTVYNIDSMDIVMFSMGKYLATIPVSIQQPPMIRLHDPGPDRKISSMVTITTKTFLRYDKLQKLLKSIRLYYPDIKVIVADDNQEPEKIVEPNVEQYIMPYAKGWFAGRNLAVSQVTTKYFLWVDDDFLFTSDTKIETLLDVVENTDLDLVGGSVAGNHFSFKLFLEEGGEEGDCLHWRGGSYSTIPGFPNCVLTAGVVNFFLAHTNRILGVGFDPKLDRVAHTEFFVDALGRLRIGSCSHVSIGHQPKEKVIDPKLIEQDKKYNSFRQNTAEQSRMKLGLHFFKNRLSCFTKH